MKPCKWGDYVCITVVEDQIVLDRVEKIVAEKLLVLGNQKVSH